MRNSVELPYENRLPSLHSMRKGREGKGKSIVVEHLLKTGNSPATTTALRNRSARHSIARSLVTHVSWLALYARCKPRDFKTTRLSTAPATRHRARFPTALTHLYAAAGRVSLNKESGK